MAISRMQNPRQMYGLGSLVKKATRGIKKIVKSPIGKAALLGGLGWAANAGMLPGGMGAGWWGKMKGLGTGIGTGGLGKWFGKLTPGQRIFTGLAGAGIAMPFIQKALKWGPYKPEEEVEEEDWTVTPGSIANLRNQARDYYTAATPDYLGSPFMPNKQYVMPNFYAADGGRAGLLNGGGAGEAQIEQMLRAEYLKYKNKGGTMPYEQFKILVMKQAQQGQMPNQMMAADGGRARKQEGGLLDMGGQEKDYRDEGGFVALGGEERADDVPARLSKNEFVFTADAVRNAGGGDIDKGSEVMQNLMDNLEQGGEVSEDSQGQNPAQGMYDNYEQLQSRVA
jgi:hypothetical protein